VSLGKTLAQATGRQAHVIRSATMTLMHMTCSPRPKAANLAGLGSVTACRILTKTTTIKG
jgi:hypothetical protein